MEEPACRLVPGAQKALDDFLPAGKSWTQQVLELMAAAADLGEQNSALLESLSPAEAEQVPKSP